MKNNNTNHFFNFINKALLLVIQQLSIIALITCVVTLFVANYVVIDRNGYEQNYKVSPFASSRSFEESEIFKDYCADLQKEILRLAVIKSQLEVDGRFDGKKIINIEEYVNRKEEGKTHYSIDVTEEVEENAEIYDAGDTKSATSESEKAEDNPKMVKEGQSGVSYYLEDLIKWGVYGFDYKEVTFYNTGDHLYYMETTDANTGLTSGYLLGSEGENQADFIDEILDERYQTIEGMPLMSYAESLENYYYWEELLVDAVESIYYNYTEYENLNPRWSEDTSNVSYYIAFEKNGEPYYYTNVFAYQNGNISESQLLEDIKNKGHYLYYAPADLVFETNTDLTQKAVLSTIQNYDYFYPENVKIWIGIDTNQYAKEDILSQAKNEYKSIVSGGAWYAALGLASFIILILTITLYTIRCLGEKEEETYKVTFWDKIPIEAVILLIAFCFFGWGFFISSIFPWINELGVIEYGKLYYTLYTSVAVWGYINLIIILYYGIIRRVSEGILWKNSILHHALKGIVFIYRNLNSFLRILLAYGGFVIFNVICLEFARSYGNWDIRFLLTAVIVDMVVFGLLLKSDTERSTINKQISRIREGDFDGQINTEKMTHHNAILAQGVNNIGEGIRNAVDKSLKDERLKTDLITNVSHDIKTPLTSIINYVDLLKREKLQNEKAEGYVEVLEAKAQRLKQLTDDLVEASKISSGNIVYQYEKINLGELLHQAEGEFSDRFVTKGLHIVMSLRATNSFIWADSRRIWRVIENLLSNINKYAMPGTRVYIDMDNFMEEDTEYISLSMKNISEQPLNIQAEELTERFIRGDVARSTEGSGLGLSIAQNLTIAQGGKFQIYLDGDLFKAVLIFKTYVEE